MTGLAAYANEHINSAARDVATYFAVQGPGPVAELEHLPQHGDAPFSWCIPKHVEHGARRIGIGVVAIVQNQNSVVKESFATHGAGSELFDRRGELSRLNAENPGHRDARQQVQKIMAAD